MPTYTYEIRIPVSLDTTGLPGDAKRAEAEIDRFTRSAVSKLQRLSTSGVGGGNGGVGGSASAFKRLQQEHQQSARAIEQSQITIDRSYYNSRKVAEDSSRAVIAAQARETEAVKRFTREEIAALKQLEREREEHTFQNYEKKLNTSNPTGMSQRDLNAAAASLQKQRSSSIIQQAKEAERAVEANGKGINKLSTYTDKLIADNERAIGQFQKVASRTEKSIEKASTQIASARKESAAASSSFSQFAANAAALGGTLLIAGTQIINFLTRMAEARGKIIQAAIDEGSRINDLSIKTGVAAETLSGLNLQAKQSGTSLEDLSTSVVFLQKNLLAASEGNKVLRGTFAQLGIRDTTAAMSDMDGTLRQVFKGLFSIRDEGMRNAVGTRVMGRAYKELSVFLDDTGGDIDAVVEKARRLGLVMSQDAAGAADRLGDAYDSLEVQSAALDRQWAEKMIPDMENSLDVMTAMLNKGGDDMERWGNSAGFATRMGTRFVQMLYEVSDAEVEAARRQRQAEFISEIARRAGARRSAFEPEDGEAAKASKAAEKQLDRYKDILTDVQSRVRTYGNETQVAAVKEQFFREGITSSSAAMRANIKAIYDAAMARAAELDQMEAAKKRIEGLQDTARDMTEQIVTAKDAIFNLGATTEEGRTHSEEFTRWLSKQTDEFLRNTRAVNAAKTTMSEWDEAERKSKERRERDSAAKGAGEAVSGLNRGLLRQLLDIRMYSGAAKKPLDELFQSLEDVKEFNLKPGAFNPLLKLLSELRISSAEDIDAHVGEIAQGLKAIFYTAEGGLSKIAPEKLTALFPQIIEGIRRAQEAYDTRLTPAQLERNRLEEEFKSLQDEVPAAAENAALRYQVAWLEATNEVRMADIEANESMIHSMARLNDQTVFHAGQARAQVLDHFAGAKSVTEVFADGFVDMADRTGDAVERALGKVDRLFGGILSNLARLAVNRVFMRILDAVLPASGGSSSPGLAIGGGGGSAGAGGFSLSGLLKGIFTGGRGGAPATTATYAGGFPALGTGAAGGLGGLQIAPGMSLFGGGGALGAPVSLSGQAGQQAQLASLLQSAGGSGAAAGGGASAGLMAGLAPAALALGPMLGLSLGSGLGKGSTAGSILGGAGGAIAGGYAGLLGYFALGGTFASGSAVASIAAFAGAAMPFLLPAAAALLIGSYLIGKKKQRDADERTRTQLSGQVYDDTIKILNAARDGSMSLAEATSAFEQVKSTYFAGVAQMKDSKTKRIATDWWNNDFYPFYWPLIQQGAKDAEKRKSDLNRMHPEFAGGGSVRARFAGGGFVGRVPGTYDRADDRLIRVSGDETVITPIQRARLGGSPAMQRAGVPGYQSGGSLDYAAPGSGRGHMRVDTLEASVVIDRDGMAEIIIDSPVFEKALVKKVKIARKDKKL